MAISAVDPIIADMMLVAEGYRLIDDPAGTSLISGLRIASRQKSAPDQADHQGRDEQSKPCVDGGGENLRQLSTPL